MSLHQPRDPFAADFQQDAGRRSKNNGCLMVVIIVFVIVLMLSVIFAVGVVLGLRRAGIIGTTEVPAPKPSDIDKQEYLDSIAARLGNAPLDREISAWIDQELSDVEYTEDTHEVPCNEVAFIQAASQSDYATNFGLPERALLRVALVDYLPYPDVLSEHTILNIQRETADARTEFATADIVFYDSTTQAFSIRWYLMKENGGWKMYDWSRLEYGRRTSDEYANFASQNYRSEAEGYDEAMLAGGRIIEAYESEDAPDIETLKSRLRAEERRPVLDADRALRDLRIAWCYEAINQPEEAQRLLRSIDDPKMIWGTLSSEASILVRLSRYKEALEVSQRFLEIAPDHPNALDCVSLALSHLDRDAEAKPYLLKLLALCPEKYGAFSRLESVATAEDLPQLMHIANQSEDKTYRYVQMLYSAFSQYQQWPAYLADWESAKQQLQDVPESFWTCVAAARAFKEERGSDAVELLKRIAKSESDPLMSFASEQLSYYWIGTRQFAELIAFEGPEQFIQQALTAYYYDGEGAMAELDPELLTQLEEMDVLDNSRHMDLVRGVYYFADDYASAETVLDRYLSAQDTQTDDGTDADEYSIDAIGPQWAGEMLTKIYLQSGRVTEVFDRFGVDEASVNAVKVYLLVNPTLPNRDQIIDRIVAGDENAFAADVAEIRAAAAFAEKRSSEADEYLKDAIMAVIQNATNEYSIEWILTGLITTRVKYAVLDRDFSRLEDWDFELGGYAQYCKAECIKVMAETSSNLKDTAGLTACVDLPSKLDIDDPKVAYSIALAQFTADRSSDAAILAMEKFSSIVANSEQSYEWYYETLQAIQRLIAIGKTQNAAKILSEFSKANDTVDSTTADLLKLAAAVKDGDSESIDQLLASLDDEQVCTWLQNEYARAILRDMHEIRQRLYDQFVPRVVNRSHDFTLAIFQDDEVKPTSDDLKNWVTAALGNDVELQDVPCAGASEAAIAVKLADGGSIIIACSDDNAEFYGNGAEYLGQFNDDSGYMIVISDLYDSMYQPQEIAQQHHQYVWLMARQAIGESTVAVFENKADVLWTRDKSNLRDFGADGLNLLDRSAFHSLDCYVNPVSSSSDETTMMDLEKMMSSELPQVAFRFPANNVSERLSGVLIGASKDSYSYRVKLNQDSVVSPELKAGMLCDVPVGWIDLGEAVPKT